MTKIDETVNAAPTPCIDEQLQTIDRHVQDLVREGSADQAAAAGVPTSAPNALIRTLPPLIPAIYGYRITNKRLARLAICAGLLGLSLWSVIPLLVDVRSIQAVVNAPIVTLRSPIDGTVSFLCPTECGADAPAQSALFEVKNPLADDGRLDVLKVEQALLEARVGGLGAQLERLTDLRENLQAAASKYQEARLHTLELEHEGAISLAKAAQAIEKQRDNEKEMYSRLQPSGAASAHEADAARYIAEAAQHSAAQSQKSVENLEEQIRALRDGVHVGPGDGRNDLPYSAQRLHEISVRMEEIKAALRQDEAKLVQLRQHVKREEERLARHTSYTATASADWVVWRQYAFNGTSIKANSPLMDVIDPGEIFVDAIVHETSLTGIRPGDTARVRLPGYNKELTAVVKRVVGSALPLPDQLLAAEHIPTSRQEAHVILSLKEPSGGWKTTAPVGLPAEVTFFSTRDLFKRLFGLGRR